MFIFKDKADSIKLIDNRNLAFGSKHPNWGLIKEIHHAL